MFAFGLGSGIAGMAGVALSQIDNVSPNLGQGYIIDSFMVVVFGGVGNLWGTLLGALSLGLANKLLEPFDRRGARQDPAAGVHHPVHSEAPARPVRAQGPGGGGMIVVRFLWPTGPPEPGFVVLMLARRASGAGSRARVPADSAFAVPPYVVALMGKYLCYAILALALDLVWGYCGILSLGHGAFFALGGYAMGMYLMRQIGARGVYANPILPDFMVFLNWKELPVAWWGFNSFAYAS